MATTFPRSVTETGVRDRPARRTSSPVLACNCLIVMAPLFGQGFTCVTRSRKGKGTRSADNVGNAVDLMDIMDAMDAVDALQKTPGVSSAFFLIVFKQCLPRGRLGEGGRLKTQNFLSIETQK